jgi:hypothetical protein
MKVRALGLILFTCLLLPVALCRHDFRAERIQDEAEFREVEARAARMEAVEDEEEKPYKYAKVTEPKATMTEQVHAGNAER